MADVLLRLVAFAGACAHLLFAWRESVGWSTGFVERVAPAWVARAGGDAQLDRAVDWAAPLAANMAAYNLALAVGLAWVALAGAAVAGTLGVFLSAWLLIAAAAALRTGVLPAVWLQGGLGLVLLVLSLVVA
jgi:uncharacterized membrane protein